jgi:flagellar biosynthetic protein FlhB
MAGGKDSSQERSLEPTPHKLLEARRRGEIAQSRDVITLGMYLGLFVALTGFGADMADGVGRILLPLLEGPDQLLIFDTAGALLELGSELILRLLTATLPLLLLPAAGVLLALVAQQSLVAATERISPRWSRVSVIANAKQRFGLKALVEFGKTLLKLLAVSTVIGLVIWSGADEIEGLARADVRALAPGLLEATSRVLLPVLAISALMSAADYVWQQFDHRRRQRMTLQEAKHEHKHTEVDAHVKQARRSRAMAMVTNRMLRDVPDADVVITNPTHYAIALKWDRSRPGSAPHCIAKGVDEIARRIQEIAREHRIALVEDRPLAHSLYDLVEIGHEIRVEHYRAVAAALHYAARQRANARPG